MAHINDIIKSLRLYQWAKNILLFAGLFFSLSLFKLPLVLNAIYGFFAFCFASSSVYLFNDLADKENDKLHPVKKHRPIASGRVSPTEAILVSIGLFLASISISAFLINYLFVYIILLYMGINIVYSFFLKQIVILDVFLISIGFLLRAIAGIVAVNVEISPWIVISTFLLALLLALGKRRGELVHMSENANKHRKSLEKYSLSFIDHLLDIVTAATIVTFALYTIADETVARFQTKSLILTTPVIIYVLFRYLYMLQHENKGEDPVKMIIHDKYLVLGGVIWVFMVAFIIYLKLGLRYYVHLF